MFHRLGGRRAEQRRAPPVIGEGGGGQRRYAEEAAQGGRGGRGGRGCGTGGGADAAGRAGSGGCASSGGCVSSGGGRGDGWRGLLRHLHGPARRGPFYVRRVRAGGASSLPDGAGACAAVAAVRLRSARPLLVPSRSDVPPLPSGLASLHLWPPRAKVRDAWMHAPRRARRAVLFRPARLDRCAQPRAAADAACFGNGGDGGGGGGGMRGPAYSAYSVSAHEGCLPSQFLTCACVARFLRSVGPTDYKVRYVSTVLQRLLRLKLCFFVQDACACPSPTRNLRFALALAHGSRWCVPLHCITLLSSPPPASPSQGRESALGTLAKHNMKSS